MSETTPPTQQEIAKEANSSGGWMVGFDILAVVFGIISIGSPLNTGLAVSLMVGVFLAAGGVMQIIHAFKVPSGGGRRIFLILAGLIALGFGIFMATQPLAPLLCRTTVASSNTTDLR